MFHKPCAVLVSCTEICPDEVAKLIIDTGSLPDSSVIEDDIKAYPWHIDTKYYCTDINLCCMERKTLGSKEFAESVEAAVINFDSKKDDGLASVESWLPFIKEFEPEILILLCDSCAEAPEVGISKISAQEWCVKHGFELVELNPALESEDEEDDDFAETTGIKRVVQALQAHMWPNLHMKDRSQHLSMTLQAMLNTGLSSHTAKEDTPIASISEGLENVEISEANTQNSHSELQGQTRTMEDRIDALLGDGDLLPSDEAGGTNFEQLFEQLQAMKQRVQDLPNEERKVYAEQVVMAFWRAIGGDEDEITGLSDGDET